MSGRETRPAMGGAEPHAHAAAASLDHHVGHGAHHGPPDTGGPALIGADAGRGEAIMPGQHAGMQSGVGAGAGAIACGGGVRLVRLKRQRGDDPADSITMRVRKRIDLKEHSRIELQRVEFDPGNPGVLLKPNKYRTDRRGKVANKFDYDPRPSNPYRRQDTRQELKESTRKARRVQVTAARAKTSGPVGEGGGLAAAPSAPIPLEENGGGSAGGVQIFDIVDLVAHDRAKTAGSKYSDITCNDEQLERVLMKLQIDEKTGFTKRDQPAAPTRLQRGRGAPSTAAAHHDADDASDTAPDGSTVGSASDDIYDLYILPDHESLLDPGAEYWIEATEDDLLPEDPDALTDESDDPDAKEVDYEDEYPESDEGEEDREDYGLYSERNDEEGDFMGSADEFDHDDGY
eukprot:m.190820 g.190820  ORF g.190820 m.190820 type:complete len:403 (+) comp18141_c0_seq1:1-1209(+)